MSTNPRKELVFREIEERQRRIRLKWFEKHLQMLKSSEQEGEDVEISPLMLELINEVAKMRKERFEKDREVNMAKLADKEALKQRKMAEKQLIIDPEILKRGPMYPVEKEIMDILYKGISSNQEGRWLYLKVRNIKGPYLKFYEPQTFQQEYGWRFEEKVTTADKKFARQSVIKPQFYRRTGVKGETLRNRLPYTGDIQIDKIS